MLSSMKSAMVMSAVMTVMPERMSSMRTNSSAVVPESTSTVSPSRTSSIARRAMACLASALTLMRRSCTETVSALCSETAPPCVRRSLPSASNASRSARTVTTETPKVRASSVTCTDALWSSIDMMAARRSSANECELVVAMASLLLQADASLLMIAPPVLWMGTSKSVAPLWRF